MSDSPLVCPVCGAAVPEFQVGASAGYGMRVKGRCIDGHTFDRKVEEPEKSDADEVVRP